jgi:hypothetical protein
MSDWRIRHEDVDGHDAQAPYSVERPLSSRPCLWSVANTAESENLKGQMVS